MTVERWIRVFAGTFILASLALAHWINPNWYWLTAFVGLNLLQSGFTRFCPLEKILARLGVKNAGAACATGLGTEPGHR
jgi:hypothetical protein